LEHCTSFKEKYILIIIKKIESFILPAPLEIGYKKWKQ
jgi:hypothetical protein